MLKAATQPADTDPTMSDMTSHEIHQLFGEDADAMLEFLRRAEESEARIRSTMTPTEFAARDRYQAADTAEREPQRPGMSRGEFNARFFGDPEAA